MSEINRLPRQARRLSSSQRRRAKVFTDGRKAPIDRNDRARVMFFAQVARHKRQITRAAVDILRALLYQFANLKDGRCFPSHKRLAEAAGCVPSTVNDCLPDLEDAGLLTWEHRLTRVRERVAGLPGVWASIWRIKRTSNSYEFPLIAKKTAAFSSDTENPSRPKIEVTPLLDGLDFDPTNELESTLLSLGKRMGYLNAQGRVIENR